MAFAVSEFKSNLKGGGARPSLFTVTLRSPPTLSNHINLPRSEFLVKAASSWTDFLADGAHENKASSPIRRLNFINNFI